MNKDKFTLIVVDFQHDFCLTNGSLFVPNAGVALGNIINLLQEGNVEEVIFTVDWHPQDHCSFKVNGGIWNTHCVQYSKGASIHSSLLYNCIKNNIPYKVINKGTYKDLDEYGIEVYLNSYQCVLYSKSDSVNIDVNRQVLISGLAGDYCVLETLKNLKKLKPKVFLKGIASIDDGSKLNKYIKDNNIQLI